MLTIIFSFCLTLFSIYNRIFLFFSVLKTHFQLSPVGFFFNVENSKMEGQPTGSLHQLDTFFPSTDIWFMIISTFCLTQLHFSSYSSTLKSIFFYILHLWHVSVWGESVQIVLPFTWELGGPWFRCKPFRDGICSRSWRRMPDSFCTWKAARSCACSCARTGKK